MTELPLWVGAMAAYPWSDLLAKRFTVADNFGVPYNMWKRMGDVILLPRAVCPLPSTINCVWSIGLPIAVDCNFKPRTPEQAQAAKEMTALLESGESFILQAPTGTGKTVLGCVAISVVARTTLVVVTKTDLIKQWRAELKSILGLPDSAIGYIQGNKFDVAGKKVVIGMVHSLADLEKYPPWVLAQFGLTIFDEVHRLGAPDFSKVAGHFNSRIRLGLTATPERRDGKHALFMAHIGLIKVKIAKAVQKFKVLRIYTGWHCPRDKLGTKIPHGAGKDMHIKKILAKSKNRNAKIVTAAFEAYNKGRNIVIFVDLTDHAEVLQSLLWSAGVEMSDVGLYIGENAGKAEALKKRIVIATWGMMSDGTNEPRLDTAILAMPRGNVEQPIGRIMRHLYGKKELRVIDFVDDDSPVYKGYAMARSSWYRRQGAELVVVTI